MPTATSLGASYHDRGGPRYGQAVNGTDWRTQIEADPAVLGGKPVVKGTRLTVTFLLSLLAQGWSEADVLQSYPHLSREGLRAALAYASDALEDEGELALPRR